MAPNPKGDGRAPIPADFALTILLPKRTYTPGSTSRRSVGSAEEPAGLK